eukprot:TRINITY_DN7982_c0_g1_i1.p1 TRINITY_DN7982_c0_g1~~TRINITY_DN7982_c0_g1_i1.p1  ORF type:complete len:622 (-),score=150.77 TRINITY_DN7982_c0_g1_i1:137-2002(-)
MELPLAVQYIAIVLLVACSGLFSGLTLGLCGLDVGGLEVVLRAGSEADQECARQIMPVRASGNLLLCTLLLGNVMVNAALSVLMADMTSGLMGFLISTAVIVVFGEIIPQATCSRYALQIGAMSVPIVRVLVFFMFPIAKPLAFCLDKLLGEELVQVQSKDELAELMRMQNEAGCLESGATNIVTGALQVYDKPVKEFGTRKADMITIRADEVLDGNTIGRLHTTGHSLVPVLGDNHILGQQVVVGLLRTRDLMMINPLESMLVSDFLKLSSERLVQVDAGVAIGVCLDIMQSSDLHLAVVVEMPDAMRECRRSSGTGMGLKRRSQFATESGAVKVDTNQIVWKNVIGLITHSDCVENIFQAEIRDEFDGVALSASLHKMTPADKVDKLVALAAQRMQTYGSLLAAGANGEQPAVEKCGRLTEEELGSLANHLQCRYSEEGSVNAGPWDTQASLQEALRELNVEEVVRKAPLTAAPEDSDWLFKIGEPIQKCAVVINGHLQVTVCQDNFQFNAGCASLLGAACLTNPEATADFAACIAGQKASIVWLTKADLDRAAASVGKDASCGNTNSQERRNLEVKPIKKRKGSNKRITLQTEDIIESPPAEVAAAEPKLQAIPEEAI